MSHTKASYNIYKDVNMISHTIFLEHLDLNFFQSIMFVMRDANSRYKYFRLGSNWSLAEQIAEQNGVHFVHINS